MTPLITGSILEWFQLLNAQELSLLVQNPRNQNSELFIAYVILSILIKKPSYLAAFFMSCMLFELPVFAPLSEASLYLLTFVIYSYVIFDIACNSRATIACGIILILSITMAYDAYHYGANGIYGTHETIIYNHIEHLALYAHAIFICTLIPYRRISDSLRRYLNTFMLITRNSVNFVLL